MLILKMQIAVIFSHFYSFLLWSVQLWSETPDSKRAFPDCNEREEPSESKSQLTATDL